ncbi:hypothetical protein [Paraburkholderia sp. D1E]|uniref:hypothetical protein n=1 Tax=Paraburkholderia sp. D1E TaxID=3461398 RepID=UPI004046082F
MRLLVRMSMPFSTYDGAQFFECLVSRVQRAQDDPDCEVAVIVDVNLPPQYATYANPRNWQPDGTYRVEALVKSNRRSLAAFIASGDNEWDLSDDES